MLEGNAIGIRAVFLEQIIKNSEGLNSMLKSVIRIILVLCSIVAAWQLPKKSFIKYLPVTLFSSAVVMIEIFYFTVHKLWKVKGGPAAMMCHVLVLIAGPYFFANLWAFHLSKGKFFLYSLINIVADYIYAFPILAFFRKINFFKIKVSQTMFFALLVTNAFINYAFQKFYEKITFQNEPAG